MHMPFKRAIRPGASRTLNAISFLMMYAGCAMRLPPAPSPLETLTAWQTDSMIVRAILDTNGLRSTPVERVARREHDRLTALTFSTRTVTVRILPRYIGGLSALRELTATDCDLKSIPHDIDYLEALVVLRLDRNRLMNIPEEIGDLPNLRELSVARNLLVELPQSLTRLASLRSLNVSRNRLAALPDSIGSMRALRALDISNNRVRSIPVSLCELDSLLTFKADQNEIVSLPDDFHRLKSLRILSLSNNRLAAFETAPHAYAELNVLQLSYNELISLPAQLAQARKLMILDVANNRLSSLPPLFTSDSALPAALTIRFDYNRLCNVPRATSTWLDSRSGQWRESQQCTKSRQSARIVSVSLGDTIMIDDQLLACVGHKFENWRHYLLIRVAEHAAVYEPGMPIGRDGLGAKVVRFISEPPPARIEISIPTTFAVQPPRASEYEIIGETNRIWTTEAGYITLESVSADSATFLFERGIRRSVRAGQSISLVWNDLRASLACRWVFSNGRGAAPAFYEDSARVVQAVGITLSGGAALTRPAPAVRQTVIAADPAATVMIYDLSGRLLASAPYDNLESLTSSMPNGNYIRKIEGGGEVMWDRFYVSR